MNSAPELIFVYNADQSLVAAARDFVTRILAPENYSCNLCMVTYGPLTIRHPWSAFLDTLHHKKTFLHRDEFRKQYLAYAGTPLPAVFAASQSGLKVLLGADEINRVKHWEELKKLLLSKLDGYGAD